MSNTLYQIVSKARLNEELDPREARYAIVAFDVLMHHLDLSQNAVQMGEFFKAAESVPSEYIGDANDPENEEAVAWYRTMDNIDVKAAECTCEVGQDWLECPLHN